MIERIELYLMFFYIVVVCLVGLAFIAVPLSLAYLIYCFGHWLLAH